MKQILVLLPILAVLLALLFFLMPYVKTPGRGTSVPADAFGIKTERIQEETGTYSIDVQYPQFGIAAIDAQLQKAVDDAVAEFKTYPPAQHDSAAVKNDLIGTYDSVYAGSGIISLRLVFSEYTGGAHPMTLLSGMNFDRASGARLELADALRLIGKSVDDVSAQAAAKLKTKLADAFFEEGATNDPENFNSFLISEDTVTFIFQQYQVAPYAAGPQEVSFARVQ